MIHSQIMIRSTDVSTNYLLNIFYYTHIISDLVFLIIVIQNISNNNNNMLFLEIIDESACKARNSIVENKRVLFPELRHCLGGR